MMMIMGKVIGMGDIFQLCLLSGIYPVFGENTDRVRRGRPHAAFQTQSFHGPGQVSDYWLELQQVAMQGYKWFKEIPPIS